MEVTVSRVTNYDGSWRVGLIYNNELWARFYHYKADAENFKIEVLATCGRYGDTFHPTMLHMYKQGNKL